MGRYKCQGIVSTLSVIILVLCFVITSHQVSYIINIFDEIVEKYVICIIMTAESWVLIQLRLNNLLWIVFPNSCYKWLQRQLYDLE